MVSCETSCHKEYILILTLTHGFRLKTYRILKSQLNNIPNDSLESSTGKWQNNKTLVLQIFGPIALIKQKDHNNKKMITTTISYIQIGLNLALALMTKTEQ